MTFQLRRGGRAWQRVWAPFRWHGVGGSPAWRDRLSKPAPALTSYGSASLGAPPGQKPPSPAEGARERERVRARVQRRRRGVRESGRAREKGVKACEGLGRPRPHPLDEMPLLLPALVVPPLVPSPARRLQHVVVAIIARSQMRVGTPVGKRQPVSACSGRGSSDAHGPETAAPERTCECLRGGHAPMRCLLA